MRIRSLCIIVLIFCLFKGNAQKLPGGRKFSQQRTDSIILHLLNQGEVPGLALGLIIDNKPFFIKTYGWKDKAKKEKNDTSTIFHAASFSKAVFGYFVMKLVDEQLIELDKPLFQYLDKPIPAYQGFKDLQGDERWKLITARHCLSHTTGFPNWRELNPKGNSKLEFFFDPGERYAYSGEGLQLLQLVIEIITGRDLESLMKEKVFIPLGMRRSSYVWQLKFENNHALPYDENGFVLQKIKRSEQFAAGSMETTIADYTRFMSAVLQGKGLSRKSFHEMLSPQIAILTSHQFPSLNQDTTHNFRRISLSYGLGWGLFYGKYGLSFFKEGHVEGWENYTIGFPEKGLGLIVMTNSSNGESIFRELVTEIIGEASIPWEWEDYTPYKPFVQLPVTKLRELTGVYERDGVEAVISLDKNSLYVEAKDKGLEKTLLYAGRDSIFFIRQFPLELQFIKDETGKVVRMLVNDEGQRYEMEKKK